MAWDTTASELATILRERAGELSQRLGGREGTFTLQNGPIPSVHVHCEDVTVRCHVDRCGNLEWTIDFPCGLFGTPRKGVCETHTDLLFETLKYGFGLEPPIATPLTRKNGVVVDAMDRQFTVLFEELEFLTTHLLFEPSRRDLAAAYLAGCTSGYNSWLANGASD
ncbi:hypothetical protein [Porphyrobacter sp. ULC335]|uniref:hypothetical protein n=1 Tax=Porphyrobacter sp. ULC335 TaxID=2854260 RepID=UPI00221F14FD|nr:hypothetical protein [Porphyrobacter sp. ULC335]UYV15260.1 hypothetical protein KVF90_14210 [Porphyrobacter sp. ULC335]